MVLKTADRGNIPPFIVMEVMRAAAMRERENKAVYHLEVGQPSTGAPSKAKMAAKAALDGDKLGYTVALGIPELREGIANYYKDLYKVSLRPENIVITTGSSAGFMLSFLAAFNPGDRVALVAPGYPCYRHILKLLGVEAVVMEAGPNERFQPTPDLLKKAMIDGPLDGFIVASPSNPSGTMLGKLEMQALSDFCNMNEIRLISDEIYQGITYDMTPHSALEFGDDAVVVNSFSKYFSMTGWRLGWMILPDDLIRSVECLAQNMYISAPTLSQIAAVGALDCRDELDANVVRYAKNREILLNELPKAGFNNLAPSDGAFYIYADVSNMTDDSVEFCARILKETGVAVTPGLDFDEGRGHQTMRFSFAGDPQEIIMAAKALQNWDR